MKEQDNLAYYDKEKNQFYTITWYDTGNNEIPTRHYIPKVRGQIEPPVMQKIANIIDKEIEMQKGILKDIEEQQTGESLRQMRLISTSKRIAYEEIKKELLSNFSA